MVKAQAGILESDARGRRRAQACTTRVAARSPTRTPAGSRRGCARSSGSSGETGARDESFAAWRRFVEALAEQRPTVLVFEDLHWADDELLDFVDELVDWVENVPLLVVATARPELLERRPGWGGGKRNALTVSLAPLADADTARLLAALLDQNAAAGGASSRSCSRAPAATRCTRSSSRACSPSAAMPAASCPRRCRGSSPRGSTRSRRRRRSSCSTPPSSAGRSGAARSTATTSKARLHSLQRKEFIRRERRSAVAGESEFAFAHLLIRDVAYAQLPRAGRAEKHVRAARWIESLAGDRGADLAELRAHHYLAALELVEASGGETSELVDPALDALLTAARRALVALRVLAGRALRDARPRRCARKATRDGPTRCSRSRWPRRSSASRASASGRPRRPGLRRARRPRVGGAGGDDSPRRGCGTSASATRRTRPRSARSRWSQDAALSAVKPDALSAHARLLMLDRRVPTRR